MPFDMRFWRINGDKLQAIGSSQLDQEQRLEGWIAADCSLLGLSLAIIGRQVQTSFGGRIDLLALDSDANSVIIELKRGRTPREAVAQILEYASWVKELGYVELDQIAQQYRGKSIGLIFQEVFGDAIPENINTGHTMVLVASELDESSERIINYLSDAHEIGINAVFFSCFRDSGNEFVGRAWLRDPTEMIERGDHRRRAPWSGYWFVNVGEGPHRNWDDNLHYGYIGAGQDEKYSRPLRRLKVGDTFFAYMKGLGYVGCGRVRREAVPIKDFVVDAFGKPLLELPLKAHRAADNHGYPEISEWAVATDWLKSYPREEARFFKGAFANQNIVCQLRDTQTLQFLQNEFGVA